LAHTPSAIEEIINTAATTPRSARGDEGEVVQRDLRELIEADKHIAQKDALATTRGGGIRFSRLISPGTTGC
jgi:hypothetical protein